MDQEAIDALADAESAWVLLIEVDNGLTPN